MTLTARRPYPTPGKAPSSKQREQESKAFPIAAPSKLAICGLCKTRLRGSFGCFVQLLQLRLRDGRAPQRGSRVNGKFALEGCSVDGVLGFRVQSLGVGVGILGLTVSGFGFTLSGLRYPYLFASAPFNRELSCFHFSESKGRRMANAHSFEVWLWVWFSSAVVLRHCS